MIMYTCAFGAYFGFSKCVITLNMGTGVIWGDVYLMDEVLHEACLSDHSLKVIY